MATLPTQILDDLRVVLLDSESFDSDRSLRSLFSGSLHPFRNSLPESQSKSERVDATITYLLDKTRADTGKHALLLLIVSLRDRVDPDDARYAQLTQIALRLEAALSDSPGAQEGLRIRPERPRLLRGLLWSGLSGTGVVVAMLALGTPLRCVVEYRLTEAIVALLVALAGGAFVLFRNLLPKPLRVGAQAVYGGVATSILLGIIVMVALPKVTQDTCQTITGVGQATFAHAAPDELLLVVVPFSGRLNNVSAFPERYVYDALSRRVAQLQKANQAARLEMWGAPADTQRAARAIGEQYGATLVVWGQFDDIAGVRAFIEIMHDVPQADVQLSGNWLVLGTLAPAQSEVGAVTRECLLNGLPAQSELLSDVALGMIQLVRRQPAEAEQIFTKAISAAAPAAGCGAETAAPYYWRGLVRSLREQYPTALADLSQALLLHPNDPLALTQRGVVRLAIGQIAAAQADFQVALDQIDPGDLVSRGALLADLGLVHELQNDLAQAGDLYQQANTIAQQRGDDLAQALSAGHLGSLALRQGNLDQAQTLQTQARDLCRKVGYRRGAAVAIGNLGLIAYQRSNPDGALDLFTQALDIDAASGSATGQGQQLLRIGVIQIDRKQVAEARASYQRALALFQSADSLAGQGRAQIGLALVAQQQGDGVAMLAALQQALALFDTVGSPDADLVRRQIQKLQG